jgi:hypothetical protein
MRKDQQNQAFPDEGNYGISMRDYFAVRALPLAIQIRTHNYNKEMGERWDWDIEEDAPDLADMAYCIADAMLKARDEE